MNGINVDLNESVCLYVDIGVGVVIRAHLKTVLVKSVYLVETLSLFLLSWTNNHFFRKPRS